MSSSFLTSELSLNNQAQTHPLPLTPSEWLVTGLIPILQVTETPKLYKEVVLPYIESIPPKRTQWVYNILNKEV
jgi:hypothetical protein